MNAVAPGQVHSGSARSVRFHQWRSRKDKLARWLIAIGGVAVIWTVVLIFFYLLWVVLPLLLPANLEYRSIADRPDWRGSPAVWTAVEEQQEVGVRFTGEGTGEFFSVGNGKTIRSETLPIGDGNEIVAVAETTGGESEVVVATDAGDVFLFRHGYEADFSAGVEARTLIPALEFPFGTDPLFRLPLQEVMDLAISASETEIGIVALGASGLVSAYRGTQIRNLLSGETSLDSELIEFQPTLDQGAQATSVEVSGNRRWLYIGDTLGRLHSFSLPRFEPLGTVDLTDAPITTLAMTLGGISVIAGDANGGIVQSMPVRGEDGEYGMVVVRKFDPLERAIRAILPEQRRKGFVALDAGNDLAVYHSTAGELVVRTTLSGERPVGIALSPRSDGILIEGGDGSLGLLEIDNEHPEVSLSSLWKKIWYENYPEPEFVWQSSAATNDFEPKFSLTPLVFGTLKAALYAMLFAVPLALMGAAYTAYFMSPGLRRMVKPTIEIMAALPTVILGFLAGLWFAPFVEENLAGIFMILLVLPPGLLLFAWYWHRYEGKFKARFKEGSEPLLLLPVLVVLTVLALWLAEPVQVILFGGDFRTWLSQDVGITYDQRNAMVVGCAMGFAVIPTIFSIAEDAVFGVPKSLSNGSLALGATPWQTMVRVVIPTASPGIFSALMIGLGRAVGETMIVLMATGNTPIMDWNIFEGMRTLAANIAVEMPESEVNSTHYRILFLAALVLFMFTFVVNTVAEVIRHRLRKKYSNL